MTRLRDRRTMLAKAILGEDRYRRAITGYTRSRQRPRVGGVDFGDLRRTEPVCREFGNLRGRPLDRYYIENFLADSGPLITGAVLEVGERTYTERFGHGVTRSDMCHVEDVPGATHIADLTDAPGIPDGSYDCVIITQTLQFIYDVQAAVATLHRIVKPGGTVLCTLPGISHLGDPHWGPSWFWNFTVPSADRLFGDEFGAGNVTTRTHGNVLTATAFLQGLAVGELTDAEMDTTDPEYPVIITVRARRPR
ncbi:methyltransferase domain-containing protein [Gordonia sp. (in: high G+C Gram-positive bacteria)]|uniref:methyltransferase domain-containing protein n=1 Tax=Gordonia sp. (in: high G+C Gram-positive bacteria) TaxID=84139 RepID=UPI003527ACBC